jgi:hypothetical protein
MRACCSAKSEHVHLTRMVLLALPFGQNSEERSLQPSMCTTRWNRRSCLVSKLLIFLCTVRFRSNVWLMKAKRHWLVDAAESLTLTTRYSTYKPPCRVVCKQLPAPHSIIATKTHILPWLAFLSFGQPLLFRTR